MIITKTWTHNLKLQNKFNKSLKIIAASSHPMAKNYSVWFNPDEILAYSMSFSSDHVYLCSTIGRKNYWGPGIYRVLNRVFKPNPVDIVTKKIEYFWSEMIYQQIEFCKTLPDFKTAIITRKLNYTLTLKNLSNQIKKNFDIEFKLKPDPIWVCNDYNNPECLQNVIYYGEDFVM